MPKTSSSTAGDEVIDGIRPWRRRSMAVVVSVVLLLVLQLVPASPAEAHGAQTRPGSRTYLCRIDGTHASGDINPSNPACAAAVALGGKQPLWDWFGVLRSDGAGRTRGYIPDGQLCSGGEPKFAGYDLPRSDWPYTDLTTGSDLAVRYNAWAAHPGEFRLYITKDGYDPTKPLGWDDLENEPFSVYDQNSPNGTDAQNGTPDYQWTVRLPKKSGQHIIYSVWSRSDSNETFYGCSDVRFDGGNGEVVGVGAGANPVGAPDGGIAPVVTVAPNPNATPNAPATTVAPDRTTSVTQYNPPGDSAGGGAGEAMADGDKTQPAERSTGPDSSIAGSVAATDAANSTNAADKTTGAGTDADGSPVIETAAVAATGDRASQTPPAPADGIETVDGQPFVATGASTAGFGEAQTGATTGTGTSWFTLLAGVVLGMLLGVISCIAVYSTMKARRLQDRLTVYDRARPQPDWDRLDYQMGSDAVPVAPPSDPALVGLKLD